MIKLPSHTFEVPSETAELAQKIFNGKNPYIKLHNELGDFYRDEAFAELFSTQGKPGASPALLAMVTVLQYMENLSDRQAAEAVRARIDWKYALGLALSDTGFDASVLSEFRSRLLAGKAELCLLTALLTRCEEKGLLKKRGRQRTDATHVLAAVRTLNRLELVGETMRHTLNVLATLLPTWLQEQAEPAWFDRYRVRVEAYRLPEGKAERAALAVQIGADGYALLTAIYRADAPGWLREVPAVDVLRQVWLQQFQWQPTSADPVGWREQGNLPQPQQIIVSPYDCEARFGRKRQTTWIGYKGHLTETCDEETPNLIVNVATTPSTEPDQTTLPAIHAALSLADRLPAQHLVDSGYVDAENLATSQQLDQIDLVGPALQDTSWQAQTPDAFALPNFTIDWAAKRVTCPQGAHSTIWAERNPQPTAGVYVRFAAKTCQACPCRTRCTTSTTDGRTLHLLPQAHYRALQQARQRQRTAEFRTLYAARAGVEGTISQAVRSFAFRQTRYFGLAKSHLQQIILATALNLARLAAWFSTATPSHTRLSTFAALNPAA